MEIHFPRKKTAMKKRISITVTEHYENREKVITTRRVPARIHYLIRRSKASLFSAKVVYKPGVENETAVGSKKYVTETLKMFLDPALIKDARKD